MTIALKALLAQHGIKQAEWMQAVIQSNGKALTKSAGNQLLNHGIYPKATQAGEIQRQTDEFLTRKGLTYDLHRIFDATDKTTGDTDQSSARRSDNDDDQLPEVTMLSQAAKKHFGLFRDPFTDDVQNPDDVFLSREQRYIRDSMYYAAKHGGFLAIVGESGAGKTTLRRDLLDRINREGNQIIVCQPRIIDKGKLTAGSICDAIIADVSTERPKQSLEAKARQIEKLLSGSSRAGSSHVLIIEEAHDLTIQTLKYLKRFWEMEDGFKKLLAIILVGQPELKSKLDERINWEAREVIRRCEVAELLPLDGNVEAYLSLKFKRVGKDLAEIMTGDAVTALQKRLTIRGRGQQTTTSMLYPLVVNNAITKAMNEAADCGAPLITADVIAEV